MQLNLNQQPICVLPASSECHDYVIDSLYIGKGFLGWVALLCSSIDFEVWFLSSFLFFFFVASFVLEQSFKLHTTPNARNSNSIPFEEKPSIFCDWHTYLKLQSSNYCAQSGIKAFHNDYPKAYRRNLYITSRNGFSAFSVEDSQIAHSTHIYTHTRTHQQHHSTRFPKPNN